MINISLAIMGLIVTLVSFAIVDPLIQKVQGVNNVAKIDKRWFSRYHTNLIRSIATFFVVYCHIGYPDNNRLTGFLGGAAVMMFLIISGYGLAESYKRNGLQHFFVKRIVLTAIPYWLITTIMHIWDWQNFNLITFLRHMTFIDPHNFWFMKIIIFQYIAFYFIMRFVKGLKQQTILFCLFGLAIYLFNPSMSWGSQAFSFFIGFVLSNYKVSLPKNKKLFYSILIAVALAIVTLSIKQIPVIRHSSYLVLNLNQAIFYMAICFAVICFTYLFLDWKVWSLLYYAGRYSFNIYLVTWIILVNTLPSLPSLSQLIIYAITSAISVVLFTYISNWLSNQVKARYL